MGADNTRVGLIVNTYNESLFKKKKLKFIPNSRFASMPPASKIQASND